MKKINAPKFKVGDFFPLHYINGEFAGFRKIDRIYYENEMWNYQIVDRGSVVYLYEEEVLESLEEFEKSGAKVHVSRN